MNKDKIKNKLQTLRRISQKTQKEVAATVGIAETAYQRYEYGNQVPNACIASVIASTLGSTVEDIWGNALDMENIHNTSKNVKY